MCPRVWSSWFCFFNPVRYDIKSELWGGAIRLRLDGERCRVYTERFEHITSADKREARSALLELWVRVERLESAAEVVGAAAAWRRAYAGDDR